MALRVGFQTGTQVTRNVTQQEASLEKKNLFVMRRLKLPVCKGQPYEPLRC